MSVASATASVSPTATVTAGSHHSSHMPSTTRRTSHGASHHAVHHHAHTTKRRQGSSTHLHNGHHHATTSSNSQAGSSRRSSEGEHGRRAMAAGLTMASMEPGKAKRKGSGDRPLKKPSRSDTNLPSLSRVNSRHSNSSNSRNNSRHSSRANSPTRPAVNVRTHSDTSIQLDEAGNPIAEVDSGEEGWEDEAKKSRQETPKAAEGGELRRTKSDQQTRPAEESSKAAPPAVTRKTTGFAGPTQLPDPNLTTYSHALNDPTHIMPAHQIKHQQSARSLHAYQAQAQNGDNDGRTPSLGRRSDGSRRSGPGVSRSSSRVSMGGRAVESPGDVRRVESGLSMTKTAGDTPPIREQQESAPPPDTSATYVEEAHSTSPSYPFPQLTTAQQLSESPSTLNAGNSPPVVQPRSRQISTVSSQAPRTLRHRYSNSSIRSVQSLRAPPHPLNSPTGYRTGIHPSSSTQTSPRRSKGPSMHHPPIAPPVISSDVANGTRWISNGLPEDGEGDVRRSPAAPRRPGTGNGAGPSTMARSSSFASIRSIATLLGSTIATSTPQSQTPSQSQMRPPPNRRPTAMEATSKAARMRSTADPAAYHASLGLSPATADTAHLISRFLPPPKTSRPAWEIHPSAIVDGYPGLGLTNGDYRESHEALVRTMMSMGMDKPSTARSSSNIGRGDGSGAITPRQPGLSISSIDEVAGVGLVKGSKGLMVSRGGWEGRSPFLLSVDRCLAQKPVRGVPGI